MAINNAGDVVGYSQGPSGMRAFLWTKAAERRSLILPGGNSSRAFAIYDFGTVVGSPTAPPEVMFLFGKNNRVSWT